VRRSCNVHTVDLSLERKHSLVVSFDKFLIITRDHLDAQNHKVVDTVVHTRQICIALIVIHAIDSSSDQGTSYTQSLSHILTEIRATNTRKTSPCFR
jgi:hypothetical protein